MLDWTIASGRPAPDGQPVSLLAVIWRTDGRPAASGVAPVIGRDLMELLAGAEPEFASRTVS